MEGFCGKNADARSEGVATGEEAVERTREERYADDDCLEAIIARKRMTVERHLSARRIDWGSQGIGESIYVHTLWIMKWKGNDSLWGKINRRAQVEAGTGISLGEAWGGWRSISIMQRWGGLRGISPCKCWRAHLRCGEY